MTIFAVIQFNGHNEHKQEGGDSIMIDLNVNGSFFQFFVLFSDEIIMTIE